MKCPVCVESGELSFAFPEGVESTCMGGIFTHFDKDGVHHDHDVNIVTRYYICSKAHRWSTKGRDRCPACDWPGVEPTLTIRTTHETRN